MKVTFIYPKFEKFLESFPPVDRELYDYFLGNFTTPPSLGIPILAALTPSSWEVELIDDNNGDPVDPEASTDLVAINCFTPQGTRALELADRYRAAGKKVVMGGFFASMLPDLALEHADAVNVGDGEPTWARILADTEAGTLGGRYDGGSRFDLAQMPIPRRDIFYEKESYDWDQDLVQVARGCTYNCAMCAIPEHQGHRIRLRPVDRIVEEIAGLPSDEIYLAEDLLFFENRRIKRWSRELFEALAPLKKRFFVSSTLALDTSPDLLRLITDAGVDSFYCTLNVDPISIRALGGDARSQQQVVDFVHKIESEGIRFFASFGIGRDWDGPEIKDTILDLCHRADIKTAEFFVFTPYPGSPHFGRLERQGRILHRQWHKYNGAHVVTRPLNMEPEDLYEIFLDVWRSFYSDKRGADVVAKLKPVITPEFLERRRKRLGDEVG